MNITIITDAVNMKTLITIILLLFPSWAFTQYNREYAQLTMKADSLFMEGDYEGANQAFEEALRLTEFVQPVHLYNGACAAALAGDTETAFRRLFDRLERQQDWYTDNLQNDEDLFSLHNDERWNALTDSMRVRKHRIEANFDKPLRRKLLMIEKTDQEVRMVYLSIHNSVPHDSIAEAEAIKEMQRVDKINQQQICQILDSRGLVGRDKVGNAVGTFWTVIQHADVETQKKYLPMFMEGAKRGDITKEGVAMLEDRINLFEGKPQRYGSQIVEDEQGKPMLYQLLDASKVDEWRQKMGMEPLDDYLKKMNAHR